MIHEYKCWPVYFAAIQDGSKPFDVRRDDRDLRPRAGELARFNEWHPQNGEATGRSITSRITYLLVGDDALLPKGWLVMGLSKDVEDVENVDRALGSPELSRNERPQPPAHAAQGDEPRVGDVWRFTDSGREFDYAVVGQRHYSDDGATVWLGQERRLDGTLGEEADITLRDPAFPDEQRKWSLVSRAPAEPQPVQDRAQAAPGWWVKPGAARRDLWAFGTDGFPEAGLRDTYEQAVAATHRYREHASQAPAAEGVQPDDEQPAAEDLALLRLIATYPWLTEVAASGYDPDVAEALMMQAAFNADPVRMLAMLKRGASAPDPVTPKPAPAEGARGEVLPVAEPVPAEARPGIHFAGEQGPPYGSIYCDHCGKELATPHTWRECALHLQDEMGNAIGHATLAAEGRDTAERQLAALREAVRAAADASARLDGVWLTGDMANMRTAIDRAAALLPDKAAPEGKS